MAEKLLKVKGVFDPGDVQTGLAGLTENLRGVGKAAVEAAGGKDAWAAFGKEVGKIKPELAGIAQGFYEAEKSVNAMGRAGNNIGALESSLIKSKANVDLLKRAMQEAEKAGVDIGPKVKASLGVLEGGVERATTKLHSLKKMNDEAAASVRGLGDTAKALDPINAKLESIAMATKGMLLAMGGQAASQAFGAVKDAIGEAITRGLEYNKTLEDSKGGLAALILANYDLANASGKVLEGQEKVSAAFAAAGELQRGLEKDASKTAETYQELINAFQSGLAPAVQLGITDMDALRKIMLAAAQAAKTLQVDGSGLAQEMRALFNFESGPDNKLANALQLSKNKLNELKAAGVDVSKWLLEQLKPYSEAAAASVKNLSVVTSNLTDAIDKSAGKFTKPLFDEMAKSADRMTKAVPEMTRGLDGAATSLGNAGKNIAPLAEALAKLAVAFLDVGTKGTEGASKIGGKVAEIIELFLKLKTAQEGLSWDVFGKERGAVLDAFFNRLIAQMGIYLPDSFGKTEEAAKKGADAIDKSKKATEEAAKAGDVALQAKKKLTEETDKAAEAEKKAAEETKKATDETKKAAEEEKKAAEAAEKRTKAIDEEAKKLAVLADKVHQHRASNTDLSKFFSEVAEKMGISVRELERLVEARRKDLDALKDSRPAYENAAEANADFAESADEAADALEKLTAAREKDREAAEAAAKAAQAAAEKNQAETDSRERDANSGGGPIAWLKDIDTAKEKVQELGKSIESLGDSWLVAGKGILVYQGQLREASAESMKLDESTQGFIDKLLKIAGLNDKNSSWIKQYIEELERSMQLSGKSYEEISTAIDQFIDKVRGAHKWMGEMNAEFVLGGSFYGDIARQMGQLAGATDEFKRSLIGK